MIRVVLRRFTVGSRFIPLGLHPEARMPVGITGRQVNVAYARSTSWSVPASVTQQLLIENTDGWDDDPDLVEDESFTQDYIGAAEIGDRKPRTPSIGMQLRFEQGTDVFLAASIGSAPAPTAIGSQGAANSLVAYQHTVTMAPDLAFFFTFAADLVNYVKEIRTSKIASHSISVGPNGRMLVSFGLVGDRTTYTSTVNTNSTVNGATIATPGNRAFRKNARLRLNLGSAGALGASDEQTLAKEFTLSSTRPLAQDDFVLGSDVIIEPDDDGFFEGMLEVQYGRMNTVTANSLAIAFGEGTVLKGDILMNGPFINSSNRRSMLFEMPAMQVTAFKNSVTGHGELRPSMTLKLRLADAAPTGMSGLTNPMRLTIVNTRSTGLLA